MIEIKTNISLESDIELTADTSTEMLNLPIPEFYPSYRSQSEADWAVLGNVILLDELGVFTKVQLYEPVTFNIPGGRYKPDFQHLLEDGRMVYVEVKMTKKMRSYARYRTKIRAAAEIHPWYIFIEAVGRGESWDVEVVR